MTAPDLRAGPSGPVVGVGDFDNMIWVNPIAALGGDGSVLKPFRTPAEAVSSVPAGASATVILAPGDYSATLPINIANRDIALICLGNVKNGVLIPRARAILPAISFAASVGTLLFLAQNCDLTAGVTVNTAVEATLQGSSAVWADAGSLSSVSASGDFGLFVSVPQNTFNGTVRDLSLFGMSGTNITATTIVSVQSFLTNGGVWTAASMALFHHEFSAASTVTATVVLDVDLWTMSSLLGVGVTLGAAPPFRAKELAPIDYMWGAGFAWDTTQFLQPNIKFGSAQASALFEWQSTPRQCFASQISLRVDTAIANDVTATLRTGANVAGLANTTLVVTLTAGQTFAQSAPLVPPLPQVAGRTQAVIITKAGGAIANNGIECHVLYL